MSYNSSSNTIEDEELRALLESTPDHLRHDPVALFLRCKYAYRDQLKQSFNAARRESIDLELQKIERLRASFENNLEHSPLLQSLKLARNEWRKYVNSRCRIEPLTELVDPVSVNTSEEEHKYSGLEACMITLSRRSGAHSYNEYHLKTYPAEEVLHKKESNPLMGLCEENTIRYFHFPANNMLWEAIARYYKEDRGQYDYREAPDYREKSSNLLRREYWKGLQYGGISDPTHTRHMRPSCSFISPDELPSFNSINNDCTSSRPMKGKNFILFMPYLHWETDRKRKIMADVIKRVTYNHQIEMRQSSPLAGDKFFDLVVEAKLKSDRLRVPERLGLKPHFKGTLLGRYIMNAAKLYEVMDIEPDVRELRKSLFPLQAPLHPRRTLDQSYHSKLQSTERRDDDQVIRRSTLAGKSIYKTTKVLMVDQVWLYILDDNTAFSFFPKRWGKNAPNFSGVYESITTRLKRLRPGEIQSVYDLGLIIMNQCSAVFFDHTTPNDDRPQLVDIFAKNIARLSEMETIIFEQYWKNIGRLRLRESQLSDYEMVNQASGIYPDITPDGLLLRESRDIIDELHIMIGIYLQQVQVAKDFCKYLHALHDRGFPSSSEDVLVALRRVLAEMNSGEGGAPTSGDIHGIMPISNQNTVELDMSVPSSTLKRFKNLLEQLEGRLNELRNLEKNGQEIIVQLENLLSLKQQQASITSTIDAKTALARADESVRQGRAIMMFTIVTIIFLPLSFMSSIFGMNARELSGPEGGILSLSYQFKLMFSISLAVIVISLTIAFNSSARKLLLSLGRIISFLSSILSFILGINWAIFVEYTGLRHLYLRSIIYSGIGTVHLHRKKNEIINNIYSRRDKKQIRESVSAATQMRERRNKELVEFSV